MSRSSSRTRMPGSPTDGEGRRRSPSRPATTCGSSTWRWAGWPPSSRTSGTTWPTGVPRSATAFVLRHPDPLPRCPGVLGRGHSGRAPRPARPGCRVHGERRGGRAATAYRLRPPALREDIVGLDPADRPANVRVDPEDPVPYTGTKGAVLLHILEELSSTRPDGAHPRRAGGGGAPVTPSAPSSRSPAASTGRRSESEPRSGVPSSPPRSRRWRPAPRRCAWRCGTRTTPSSQRPRWPNAVSSAVPSSTCPSRSRQTGARSSSPFPTAPRRCSPCSSPSCSTREGVGRTGPRHKTGSPNGAASWFVA